MSITAAQVKELRERTGAGMMECKRALQETGGDMDAAVDQMRRTGLAKADKKADRVAAEGRVVVAASEDGRRAAIVEINCETDFVGGGDQFGDFAGRVAELVLEKDPADPQALGSEDMDGRTLEEARKELVATLGENITVRRFSRIETRGDVLGSYLHGTRIGVLVDLAGGDAELARDIAMHVAASQPAHIAADDVPADVLESEREILRAQAEDSGKPAEIVEKMVEGRLRKHLAEITLLGQPFVKDPDITVEKLLAGKGAQVRHFVRYEVGEGIEKKEENFAEEVRAQAEGR